MLKYLLSILILLPFFITAQDSSAAATKSVFTRKWDTTKYQKFDYVFIVGAFQQYRNFDNEFKQVINKDTLGLSTHDYVAESQLNSGLNFCFDKFQVSFGTRSSPQAESAGKGYTRTFNIGFNIGDNNYVLENYYRRFVGFYNRSTPNFDTTFKTTNQYYLQPNLRSDLFMSRFMYFTNSRKFSFKSGFGCNYRQLRSAATWILGGSFNVYNLSNDSSIFPAKVRPLFNDYANLKGLRSINFSMNYGAAITIVILKAWFISGYFTVGPEQQWRKYNFGDHYSNLSYISFSGTGRVSLGLNLKRFYMLGSYSSDYNLFNSAGLNFKSAAITGNFAFGWRFHTGNPKFYQKFQRTKIYKML